MAETTLLVFGLLALPPIGLLLYLSGRKNAAYLFFLAIGVSGVVFSLFFESWGNIAVAVLLASFIFWRWRKFRKEEAG